MENSSAILQKIIEHHLFRYFAGIYVDNCSDTHGYHQVTTKVCRDTELQDTGLRYRNKNFYLPVPFYADDSWSYQTIERGNRGHDATVERDSKREWIGNKQV